MKTPPMVTAAVAAATFVDPSTAFSSRSRQKPTPTPTDGLVLAQSQSKQQEDIGVDVRGALQMQLQPSRRAFFDAIVSKSSAAGVTAAVIGIGSGFILPQPEPANAAIKTGASNSFTGDYDDPNHPGCLRQVKVVGGPLNGSGTRSAFPVVEITGWDGDDNNNGQSSKVCNTRPPSRDYLWQVKGSVRSPTTALVDFSSRGGPDDPLLVTYENGGIVFPDGNKWKKVPEQKDRRPKDMSTLSDGPKFREKDDDDDY